MVLQEDPVDSGVNVELLAKLVVLGIRGRNVWTVIDTLKKVQGLEISLSAHLNASAMDVIAAECRRMVMSGHIAEAVELMEVLARNFFSPISILE